MEAHVSEVVKHRRQLNTINQVGLATVCNSINQSKLPGVLLWWPQRADVAQILILFMSPCCLREASTQSYAIGGMPQAWSYAPHLAFGYKEMNDGDFGCLKKKVVEENGGFVV